jgi:hypothetical protein
MPGRRERPKKIFSADLTAKMVDILTGVNRPRQPIGFIPLAVPCISVSVAVHDRPRPGSIGLNRFGQRLQRNPVFVHPATYPQDEALTRVPIEVEQPLFFSLFHNVPMSRLN